MVGDGAFGVGLVGGVGRDADRVAARGPDRLGGGVGLVLGAVRDRDLRAGAGEGRGDRAAHGAPTARDEGDLALEAEGGEIGHGECSSATVRVGTARVV